jgi:hypothetical protein
MHDTAYRKDITMKKITLALISVALISCATPTKQLPAAGIKSTTDEFSGITSLETGSIKLNVARSIKLTKLDDKSGMSAVVFTYMKDGAYDSRPANQTWEFAEDNFGWLLIDGEREALGPGKHSGDVRRVPRSWHINEAVGYVLKPEVIRKLSMASKVEGRVGKTKFTLTPTQVNYVKEFSVKAI